MQISEMILEVNIISGKMSVASVNGAGGSRGVLGGFRGQSSLRWFLGSKEYLDWLKIDLNLAEIITAQDYKHKKINVNGSLDIQC